MFTNINILAFFIMDLPKVPLNISLKAVYRLSGMLCSVVFGMKLTCVSTRLASIVVVNAVPVKKILSLTYVCLASSTVFISFRAYSDIFLAIQYFLKLGFRQKSDYKFPCIQRHILLILSTFSNQIWLIVITSFCSYSDIFLAIQYFLKLGFC